MRLENILARISEIIDSETDADIARALNTARSSLSTWKKRDHVPYKNIVEFCLERDIPIEKVLVGTARKGERIYEAPAEALEVVLEVQSALNLAFTADQIKSLLAYAYKSQADKDELMAFVEAAFTLANINLPVSEARS